MLLLLLLLLLLMVMIVGVMHKIFSLLLLLLVLLLLQLLLLLLPPLGALLRDRMFVVCEEVFVCVLEGFSSFIEPSGEGGMSLGVSICVETEAERGGAMSLRQVAGHEFLAELKVKKAQLGKNADRLAISSSEEPKFGTKGIGGSREAASFSRWKCDGFLEESIDFCHGNIPIVQTHSEKLQPLVYHLVGAVEREGDREEKRGVRWARKKGVKVLELSCKSDRGLEGEHFRALLSFVGGLVSNRAREGGAAGQ